MRSRVVAGLAVLAALSLGCSENPSGTPSLELRAGSANAGLNTVEGLIEALFPNGTETAALQRWASVERALDKNDDKIANRHMTQLAAFVLKNESQRRLDDPDGSGSMSVRDGVLRLISLMFGEVNGGPAPPTSIPGDYVIAIVDGSHQTVVTPTRFAGVEFPAGAAAEPFLLVVKENMNRDYGECQGPLATELCQYPRFYSFDPYPHVDLAKEATFGVCLDARGLSKEVDDRLRLAHDAPEGPRPPRYIRVDGIEILPYVQTKFLHCEPKGGEVIGFLEKLLLPRKAYAIDLGGGGQSDAFSNFNIVDPGSRSELSPEAIVIAEPGTPPKNRDR